MIRAGPPGLVYIGRNSLVAYVCFFSLQRAVFPGVYTRSQARSSFSFDDKTGGIRPCLEGSCSSEMPNLTLFFCSPTSGAKGNHVAVGEILY